MPERPSDTAVLLTSDVHPYRELNTPARSPPAGEHVAVTPKLGITTVCPFLRWVRVSDPVRHGTQKSPKNVNPVACA